MRPVSFFIAAGAFMLAALAAAPAHAQLSEGGGPVSYSANNLEYFDSEHRLVLVGDVDIVQNDARLRAEGFRGGWGCRTLLLLRHRLTGSTASQRPMYPTLFRIRDFEITSFGAMVACAGRMFLPEMSAGTLIATERKAL